MRSPLLQFFSLIRSPRSGWGEVFREGSSVESLCRSFLVPVTLIPSVSYLLGFIVFEGRFFTALYFALVSFLVHFSLVPAGALLLVRIKEMWEEEEQFKRVFALLAFAVGPAYIAGIAGIFPGGAWIEVVIRFFGYLASLALLVTGVSALSPASPGKVKAACVFGSGLLWLFFKLILGTLVPFYNS